MADMLSDVYNDASDNMMNLDEPRGVIDLSQNGSNSISNGIKSITEETADIIASYPNAIRLDVCQ